MRNKTKKNFVWQKDHEDKLSKDEQGKRPVRMEKEIQLDYTQSGRNGGLKPDSEGAGQLEEAKKSLPWLERKPTQGQKRGR